MIDKKSDITSMENSQVNILNNELDSIRSQGMSVKHTDVLPTVKTVPEGQMVVYDSAAVRGVDDGVKRLYFVTNKGNLGYITLT